MYSPKVIRATAAKLEAAYGIALREFTIAECQEYTARLASAVNEDGVPQRALLPDEQAFIQNELLLCKASFRYCAERYMSIVTKRSLTQHLFPLLDSQAFVLQRLGDFEEAPRHDGILVNVLKAKRQVGITTLFQALVAHRLVTQADINALVASDIPSNSGGLFTMMKTYVNGLPWWLRPAVTDDVKNTELVFASGSRAWVHSGKSMSGSEGSRGQIGRSRTVVVAHLSELSTWEWPDQIDDSLLEAIPEQPHVLVGFETTAQGRGTWMHEHWKNTRRGRTRFRNIFIPWYVERSFTRPAPSTWSPAPVTLEHAARIAETSPRWCGRVFTPTKDQLFWWESKREEFEAKDNLHGFLQEVGSIDDDECFQTGGSIFLTTKELDHLTRFVKAPAVQLEVLPLSGSAEAVGRE